MPSERIQRHVDSLLAQAEEAIRSRDWSVALEAARAALAIDPENEEAAALLRAAEVNVRPIPKAAPPSSDGSAFSPAANASPADRAVSPSDQSALQRYVIVASLAGVSLTTLVTWHALKHGSLLQGVFDAGLSPLGLILIAVLGMCSVGAYRSAHRGAEFPAEVAVITVLGGGYFVLMLWGLLSR